MLVVRPLAVVQDCVQGVQILRVRIELRIPPNLLTVSSSVATIVSGHDRRPLVLAADPAHIALKVHSQRFDHPRARYSGARRALM